jgi:diacylglycerol kinase
MKDSELTLRSRFKSFSYAWNGLKILFLEPNFKIHLFAMICVSSLGLYFQISRMEWIFILFAIGFVLICETLNTSIEYLADSISLEYNKNIEIAKDLGATAVLLSSFFAVAIGLIIFFPKVSSI